MTTLELMVQIQKMNEVDFVRLLGFIQNEITIRSIRKYAEQKQVSK